MSYTCAWRKRVRCGTQRPLLRASNNYLGTVLQMGGSIFYLQAYFLMNICSSLTVCIVIRRKKKSHFTIEEHSTVIDSLKNLLYPQGRNILRVISTIYHKDWLRIWSPWLHFKLYQSFSGWITLYLNFFT